MGELITEPRTFVFDLDDLYILDLAMRDHEMKYSGWDDAHKKRVDRLHKAFQDELTRQQKPAREEQILRQARDILRERGIKSWSL